MCRRQALPLSRRLPPPGQRPPKGGTYGRGEGTAGRKGIFQGHRPFLFVIPFLIAVFCVLLFTAIHLLTREQRGAEDYLADIKTGGLTKRWQGAFELSKILANPELVPDEDRFFQNSSMLLNMPNTMMTASGNISRLPWAGPPTPCFSNRF